MISSNGAATFRSAFIGLDNLGSLTMPGGTFNILSNLTVGSSLGATGVIVMNGGINLIGGALIIGKGGGKGHVILSSGSGPFSPGKGGGPGPLAGGGGSVLRTRGLTVSTEPGSTGTLTVSDSAATVDVYSNLVIGDCAASVAGYVEVSAGTLSVTNATGDAFLDLRDGAVTLSGGGILRVNRLVLTNSCGLFIRTGGTLIVNSMSLDPNLDADGDGIPNGYESSHGLDPLNAADANLDADGDGFTNLQEFQTGTDPTNSASAFRVTSVVPEGNNLRVTWTTGAGRTNSLQAANGAVNGGFNTNSFTDLFIVTNAVGSTTNYLDAGAVTNKPSRYYRIRLVP
jgi:hypothetical protein